MASVFGANEQLSAGESRTSDNGQYRLDMQQDGNLVLYRTSDNAPLWAAGTNDRGGTRAVMQDDGNLVVYKDSDPLWASDTSGHPGASLSLQDDGNLVVYEGTTPLWATDTAVSTTSDSAASLSDTSSTSAAASGGPDLAAMTAAAESTYGTVQGSGLSRVYITRAGDTLESIAAYFYGSADAAQRIRDENPTLTTSDGTLTPGIHLSVSEDAARGDTVAGS